ncbi:MAG: hypothetical protein AAB152_02450 [Candidatus Coatesbacteria bacterium]
MTINRRLMVLGAAAALGAAATLVVSAARSADDSAKPPAAPALPPQPHEWLAPSVDLTPPPAEARWGKGWVRGRSLPIAMAGHRAVADGSFIYVIGGLAQREHIGQRDVWMTRIDPSSTQYLSPWKKLAPLPVPVAFFDTVVYGGRVYIVGGSSREGMQFIYDTVLSAPFKKGGGLGSWRTERAMPSKLVHPAAATVGGYLYVLGGFDGSEYHPNMSYAKFNSDGTLQEWKDARAMYPHKVGRTVLAPLGNDLVAIGGYWSDSQGQHTTALIMRGVRDPDGNVKEWVSEGGLKVAARSLRFSLAESAGAADGNFIYLAGGSDPDSMGVATTQAAWINAKTGALTRWQFGKELPLWGAKGAPQTARLYQSAAAIAANHMVVLGGFLFVRECTDLVWVQPLKDYREPDWVKGARKP